MHAHSRENTPTLRQRLGGRWAVSWQATVSGIALVIVLATASGGGIGVSAPTLADLPSWFFASCIGGAAVGLYIGLASLTILRHRRRKPVPLAVAVSFHAGIGVVFALVFVGVSRAFGLTFSESLAQMVIGFALAGLWFCLSMTLVLDARERFLRNRARLLEDAVSLELSHVHQSKAIERLQSVMSRVESDERFDPRDWRTSSLLPLDAWWTASADLQHGEVSTLESSLRHAAEELVPAPRFGAIVHRMWSSGSLAPLGTAAVFVIGYYRPVVESVGLGIGLIAVTVVAALLCACLLLADRLLPAGPARMIAGIALAFGAGWVTVEVFAPPLTTVGALGLSVAVAVGAFVFVLLPSAIRTLETAWSGTNADLRALVHERLREQRASTDHLARAAAAMEVPVGMQPAVLAVAAGLSKASRSDGSRRLATALEWSVAALEDLDSARSGSNLAEGLSATVAPWLGLCAITLDIAPAASRLDGEVQHAAKVTLEEGLAYACGQAAAERVRVEVSADPSAITLAIRHDGSAVTDGELPSDARWRCHGDGHTLVSRILRDTGDAPSMGA